MSQSIQIQQSTRQPFDTLWWRPVLSLQRDLNRALREVCIDSPTPILNPTLWDAEMELFESVQRNTHRLFCDLFNLRQAATPILTGSMPKPYVDIVESSLSFRIKAGLPGLATKDLEVSIADSALIISGNRSGESPDRSASYLRQEYRCGAFCRTIALPEEADLEEASAELERNVLTVVVPKKMENHVVEKKGESAVIQLA